MNLIIRTVNIKSLLREFPNIPTVEMMRKSSGFSIIGTALIRILLKNIVFSTLLVTEDDLPMVLVPQLHMQLYALFEWL